MTKPLALFVASTFVAGSASAVVLYSDTFDNGSTPTQAFDGSSTPEVNLLGASNVLEQYGSGSQENHVDRWRADSVSDISGLSWDANGTRYNWATGAHASTIALNGLRISGLMRTGNGGDFLAFGFGMDGTDPVGSGFGTVYSDPSADWGIRFENDRMISFDGGTTTPRYRTDVDPGAYNFGNYNPFTFQLDLVFDDGNFDAGSTVTASLILSDGTTTQTYTDFDTWTLAGTDEFIIDMAYHVTGSGEGLLYDIEVASVPEPGVALLGGLGVLGLLRRRRSRS